MAFRKRGNPFLVENLETFRADIPTQYIPKLRERILEHGLDHFSGNETHFFRNYTGPPPNAQGGSTFRDLQAYMRSMSYKRNGDAAEILENCNLPNSSCDLEFVHASAHKFIENDFIDFEELEQEYYNLSLTPWEILKTGNATYDPCVGHSQTADAALESWVTNVLVPNNVVIGGNSMRAFTKTTLHLLSLDVVKMNLKGENGWAMTDVRKDDFWRMCFTACSSLKDAERGKDDRRSIMVISIALKSLTRQSEYFADCLLKKMGRETITTGGNMKLNKLFTMVNHFKWIDQGDRLLNTKDKEKWNECLTADGFYMTILPFVQKFSNENFIMILTGCLALKDMWIIPADVGLKDSNGHITKVPFKSLEWSQLNDEWKGIFPSEDTFTEIRAEVRIFGCYLRRSGDMKMGMLGKCSSVGHIIMGVLRQLMDLIGRMDMLCSSDDSVDIVAGPNRHELEKRRFLYLKLGAMNDSPSKCLYLDGKEGTPPVYEYTTDFVNKGIHYPISGQKISGIKWAGGNPVMAYQQSLASCGEICQTLGPFAGEMGIGLTEMKKNHYFHLTEGEELANDTFKLGRVDLIKNLVFPAEMGDEPIPMWNCSPIHGTKRTANIVNVRNNFYYNGIAVAEDGEHQEQSIACAKRILTQPTPGMGLEYSMRRGAGPMQKIQSDMTGPYSFTPVGTNLFENAPRHDLKDKINKYKRVDQVLCYLNPQVLDKQVASVNCLDVAIKGAAAKLPLISDRGIKRKCEAMLRDEMKRLVDGTICDGEPTPDTENDAYIDGMVAIKRAADITNFNMSYF